MRIQRDNLEHQEVRLLLEEHLASMNEISPPESVHALDIEGLKASNIRFWTVWENSELLACGALKELDNYHGEIKSMRTKAEHRRRGIARKLLQHIITQARTRGLQRLSLETGSMAEFRGAHRLYEEHGFERCPPFSTYKPDPNSICMTLTLAIADDV